jgi:hypothetical protein
MLKIHEREKLTKTKHRYPCDKKDTRAPETSKYCTLTGIVINNNSLK